MFQAFGVLQRVLRGRQTADVTNKVYLVMKKYCHNNPPEIDNLWCVVVMTSFRINTCTRINNTDSSNEIGEMVCTDTAT